MDWSGTKRSRLDRAFLNVEWANKGDWTLIATNRKNSDHRGIVIFENKIDWGPKPFKVFNIWFKQESLIKLIEEKSRSLNSQTDVQKTIKRIRQIVIEWNAGVNGNIFQKIVKIESKISDLEDGVGQKVELDALKVELEELTLTRDCMLRQQARITWLKEGDRNIKLFYQAIQRRRWRNNIKKLSHLGKTLLEPKEIKEAFF